MLFFIGVSWVEWELFVVLFWYGGCDRVVIVSVVVGE